MEESPHCPFDVVEACRTGDLDTGSGDRGTRFRLPPGRWWWRCGRDGPEWGGGAYERSKAPRAAATSETAGTGT